MLVWHGGSPQHSVQTTVVTTTLNGETQVLRMDDADAAQVECLTNADPFTPRDNSMADVDITSFFQSSQTVRLYRRFLVWCNFRVIQCNTLHCWLIYYRIFFRFFQTTIVHFLCNGFLVKQFRTAQVYNEMIETLLTWKCKCTKYVLSVYTTGCSLIFITFSFL